MLCIEKRAFGVGVSLLALVCACVPPADRRPGLWLSGEVVEAPVADWSFTGAAQEIFVETRTWYGIPHSVTTVLVEHAGTLYVPSLFQTQVEFPLEKYWTRNIARDPRVRLQIEGKLYPRLAALVTDPAEYEAVFDAFALKYERWKEFRTTPPEQRPTIYFVRMDPVASGAG
jgi:hypothetical protein